MRSHCCEKFYKVEPGSLRFQPSIETLPMTMLAAANATVLRVFFSLLPLWCPRPGFTVIMTALMIFEA